MQNVSIINLTGAFIYLMEIEPEGELKYQEKLTFLEKKRLETIKSPVKRLEFSASRYLKFLFFGNEEIEYLEHGTPVLEQTSKQDGKHFTITHSKHFTAIGINDHIPFAIDLEQVSGKAQKLSSKFCSTDEQSFFNMNSNEEMTLMWSMKEVLYKLSDRNGLDFKRDIKLRKVGSTTLGTVLLTNGILEVELHVIEINGFYLTCNTTYTILNADS